MISVVCNMLKNRENIIKIHHKPLVMGNIQLKIDNNIHYIRKKIFSYILFFMMLFGIVFSLVSYFNSKNIENRNNEHIRYLFLLVYTVSHICLLSIVVIKPMLENVLDKNIDSEIVKINNCFIPGYIVNMITSIVIEFYLQGNEEFKDISEVVYILVSIVLSLLVNIMMYRLMIKTERKVFMLFTFMVIIIGMLLPIHFLPGYMFIVSI